MKLKTKPKVKQGLTAEKVSRMLGISRDRVVIQEAKPNLSQREKVPC